MLVFAGFIAWYLEKVLPSQWGPRLPWWFILSKTWWCVTPPSWIATWTRFLMHLGCLLQTNELIGVICQETVHRKAETNM